MSIEIEIKNREDLFKAIKEGTYDVRVIPAKTVAANSVIDEDKSVRWNREEVEKANEAEKFRVREEKAIRSNMIDKLTEDIVRVVSNESGLSEKKVEVVYIYAMNETSSSSIWETIDTLDELVDLINEVNSK